MTNARTLAAYEAAAQRYADHAPGVAAPLADLLGRLAGLVGPGGAVLELGSGPGNEALHLGELGVQVRPSDATAAFVAMMRSRGLPAERIDVLVDDLGGPHDAVLANAVFLHLSRAEFATVVDRCAAAVRPGGWLVFTVKRGDGDAWSTAKLHRPRHFTYWQPDALRAAVTTGPWQVESLDLVAGRTEEWLYVVCRRR